MVSTDKVFPEPHSKFAHPHTHAPSLSQKCSHDALVTRLPVQLCAISCATTLVSDLRVHVG